MDDLVTEFITETNESLAEIDSELVTLEQNPNDKGILGNIFRLMHTIKGTCGFLGLPRLEKTAHHAENVLGKFRDGELQVTPDYVTLIFESIDRIKYILGELEATGAEPDGSDQDIIEKLDAVYEGRDQGAAAPVSDAPAADDAVSQLANRDVPIEDDPNLSDAEKLALLEAEFDNQLKIASAKKESDTPAQVEVSEVAEAAPAPTPAPAENPQQMVARESSVAAQSLRVNVDVLENLMTMVSELVLTRNQLLQILRISKESEFSAPLQRLNHVVSDLQEGVMKTRMQPIGNAWSKLPRIIRDISIDLGKKLDLEMRGQETELDRQVLELIKDPLTHMVRNSADHGVEMPADRVAAGKPETGKIILEAFHEGGHIIIQIKDDGKGLNTDRIKQKALDNKLVTPEDLDSLSDKQIHQFIFHAGFSTAEKVTSVSGRGVGMDVVRTNIEKIGGTIDLTSIEGKGSTFTIKIPLTLAIVSALIVAVGDERFAIPQLSVQELVMASSNGASRIEMIKGTPVFRLRDHLLPLVSLKDLLHLNDADEQERDEQIGNNQYIVVTKLGGYTFGIIVDKVFDTEEIVVKPVAKILQHIDMFSGNTILGDGTVIMILDPAGIAKATGEISVSETAEEQLAQEALVGNERSGAKTSLLLFKAGDDTPKAVPLSLVSRLEDVDLAKIEYANNQMLIQYRGGLMPLIKFSENTQLKSEGRQPTLVFSDDYRSMGLVVDEIVDIVEDYIDVQISSDRDGRLGSSIIKGKATDIIDVGFFLGHAFKDWFKDHGDEDFSAAGAAGQREILLVDDSPFFRNMLTPLLSVAGYNVTTAENPLKALEIFEQKSDFDLIISDIEMPEMDGFEFAEKIKENANWSKIPMVALTSHSTPKDVERGMDVGFTKYVAKFDKDTLLNTLNQTFAEKEA